MCKLVVSPLGRVIQYLLTVLIFIPCIVKADFLKMPEIEELREIKQKTLLKDINIPAVRDRLPDPLSGPRLAVAEFRIQGLVEFPELGITREAIGELVEGIRFDLMEEGKVLESGYTLNELGEISDLLVDIEEETIDRHVTNIEVQKLVWLIRAQQGKRGVTIGQIEGVANSITQFYRERGFILAKAYIPKQQVRDGIVNLTVLLGTLGEVEVLGNDIYSKETITSIFEDQLDKPVTNEVIEESLFVINGFPGVYVDGYFEPGTQVGDTRLNVNVRNETRYRFNTRIDNHGSDESGLYRLFLGAQVNNLLGYADYLSVSFLQTAFPENTTFGQLNYESYIFGPRYRLGLDLSQNQFVVDQSSAAADFNLGGVVNVYATHASYIAKRSRKNNQTFRLRYEKIFSDLTFNDAPEEGNYLDEELTHISFSYQFDILDDVNKLLHELNVNYDKGHIDFGVALGQEEDYHVFSLDYTLLSFMKVPFTDSTSRLIFRTYSQYSGTNLSSIARFSLTGPTKVRGFSPSYFTADDAIYLGADWIFNTPEFMNFTIAGAEFNSVFKPFVFVDYAFGYQHLLSFDEEREEATAHLADVGIGLQIAHKSGFNGNIQLAVPVVNELDIAGEDPEHDSVRLTFDFQYAF